MYGGKHTHTQQILVHSDGNFVPKVPVLLPLLITLTQIKTPKAVASQRLSGFCALLFAISDTHGK